MDHEKRKSSGPREALKQGPPLGLVIALAAAGGVVIGAAGTYLVTKPSTPPEQSVAPTATATAPAPTVTLQPPQQQSGTPGMPAAQPPGPVPPGKVWSAEHGHWHDVPVPPTGPPPVTTPAVPTPAPSGAPPAKKE